MASSQQEIQIPVKGMVCANCKTIIEREVKKMKGISQVIADVGKGLVTVRFDASRTSFADIQKVIEKAGYHVETSAVGSSEWRKSLLQFFLILLGLGAALLLVNRTGVFSSLPTLGKTVSYFMLFVIGLATSLHCVGMCGGINLSQCMPKGQENIKGKQTLWPSFQYNLGRVISYTVIGGIVGAIGKQLQFSGHARGIVTLLAGLFMLLMALQMTGLFPGMAKLIPHLPKSLRMKSQTSKGPLMVGLANGLMPCGPLQMMQIYALGTGSALAGALSMLFFSLGTVPLMFGLGAVTALLGTKFRKNMVKISAALVLLLGFGMMMRGFHLSGIRLQSNPQSTPTPKVTVTANPSAATQVPAQGEQVIHSQLTAYGYPEITVKKGIPVKWILSAKAEDIGGCNQVLVIPSYNIEVYLHPGDNIINFTPTDSGVIPYSCSMGMINSQINVED